MKCRTLLSLITITVLTTLTISSAAQEQANASTFATTANPVPLINQPLVPDAIKPGTGGFLLTVNGTGFVSGSVVRWNGKPRATTFVSSSHLTASILATDITQAGTASITVFNPSPGGGTSSPTFFTVTNPTPAISLNIAAYGTGSGPQSFAVADVKGNGKLDLAVPNLYSNTVSILLGNGDGTFQEKVGYATGLNPTGVAAGDFNSDGKLDLAVATAGGPSVGVLLGNGDGTFQAHVDYPTGPAPQAVAVGDFNGDGHLDLATANGNGASVSILLGNGDGTFQPHLDYGTGDNPQTIAVGDFNGDGHLDLAVANTSGSVSILLGNGDGSFKPRVDYPIPLFTWAVAVGDFNGDGKLDLAVGSFVGGNNLSILLGNGDGTFQGPVEYATGNSPVSVAVGDLNGYGKLDLVVGGGPTSLLLGNGDGTFQAPLNYPSGSNPQSIAVGDFNGDGRLDVAVAGDGTVSILLQSPTVSLSHASLIFPDQVIGTANSIQAVKLTNTGYRTLKIASIGITGPDMADFLESHTCGSSLAVGFSCTINVSFKPNKIGPRTASLAIVDNGVGSPQTVALTGIGVVSGANATLSTPRLKFIPQDVGSTSPGQSLKLSNYGTISLNMKIVTSVDFNQNNACGSSLSAGASCMINVSFTPTQPGNRNGLLSITDNAPGSPQTVSLSGTGALSTTVTLSPSSLNFRCQLIWVRGPHCQCTPSQTVSLTDTGSATLYVNGITTTRQFPQTNTCGATLGPQQSCTIAISASPVRGTYTGQLSVYDTGKGSPQTVTLTEQNSCP